MPRVWRGGHNDQYYKMTKILVVEDEPANRRVLSYFLSHEGYEVVGAKDGLEALELYAQSRFDLVLSDLKMPRMDGISLARHILSTAPTTPVFLMSGYDFDDIRSIRELGVPCMRKPRLLNELLSTVQTVLADKDAR